MIDGDEGSDGLGKSNSLVLHIEVSVESFDESISQNESFSQNWRQIQAQNTNNASRFSSLVDLQNIILASQRVNLSIDLEIQSRKSGPLGTINLFLSSTAELLSHFIDNFSWSNNDWCSSINDTQKVASLVAGSIVDDIVHIKSPVISSAQSVISKLSGMVFGIDTSQNKSWSIGTSHFSQVEREGVAINLLLFN